ncbi:hypothetical protein KBZ13_04045 [Cyanobium sp. ATX 6F1]|nr:hypothetical protein [Cyanobium sp. ATX 6F1]
MSAATVHWATGPTIPVVVHGAAVFLDPHSRVGIYARSAGQIQRLALAVGDPVEQGQLVATINRIDEAAPGGGAVGPNLGALQEQLKAIDLQQAALRAQIAAIRTSNQPIEKQVRALDDLRREEVIPRYSPLWIGAQDLYLRNAASIHSLEGALAQLDANRSEIKSRQSAQVVLSPRSGELLSLAVNPGQSVAPGQRIGSVGERVARGPRIAVALFTEADAARLRRGDEIELEPQLQTRAQYGGTEQRYGTVRGRIVSLSPAPLGLEALAAAVGGAEEASSLMVRTRQEAFGEGGDPLAVLGDKATSPLVLARVEVETAPTPSGLRWSRGQGPNLPIEAGAPGLVSATVERRSLLSFVLPFLRWLGGV